MGQLLSREEWEEQLSRDAVDALKDWLKGRLFDLDHRQWFTEGRSDDPVARVMRIYKNTSDQRILKFFTKDGVQKVVNIRRAWDDSNDFCRHLAKPEEEAVWHEDLRGIFLHVAGGNLGTVRPLTELRDTDKFPRHCATIARSVVADWNGGRTATTSGRRVREVLAEIMGRRLDSAQSWAATRDIDVAGSADAVALDGWPEAPVNPFTLLAGAEGERMVEDLIVGKAHGDLSGRNILVPTDPQVGADLYVLIDYDRFADNAPLARDPMHLLVALVLDGLGRVGRDSLVDLTRVLVDPGSTGPSFVEPIHTLSSAVRAASAPKREKGLGDKWTQQCLLSLVGAGLVHLGRDLRTLDSVVAKPWCFHLAAVAAQAYLRIRPERNRRPVVTASQHPAGTTSPHQELVNRATERRGLRTRLTSGPWGVVVLRGTRGVGKTALVDAVLNELAQSSATGEPPRIRRYDVNTIAPLDAPTLINFVEGDAGPSGPLRHGGSSLVRLESVLRRLGESRVVISVDSAENLLSPVTKRLVDPDLDEALELLATEPGHRVTVLLVTQDEPASPGGGTWPMAEEPIVLPKLRHPDFFVYLANLDRNGSLGLADLPDEQRRVLHNRLQGNPRLAELVYGVVVHAETGLNLSRLTDNLRDQESRDVPTYLTRVLVGGLTPLRRSVLEALAAFDTPVPASAVVGLLKREESPELVGQALSVLAAHRVVYRVDSDHFFLPRHDGILVLQQLPDEKARAKLYFSAATRLTQLQHGDPRDVADLRVHFAELTALLRAREYPSAENMIRAMDKVLRRWNCSHHLLEQREEVRGKLADHYLEMLNEDALGGIYVALGDLPKADVAYGKALAIARARHDDARLMRILGNLAAMYWQCNDIERALGYFDYARERAVRADDLVVQMGALEGIADCHRRRGHYDQAIRSARTALAIPGLVDYPGTVAAQGQAITRGVTIALKLARWYGELGEVDKAARHVEIARAATENSDDYWLRASYLDGHADLLFDRDDRSALEEAELSAQQAVDLALRLEDRVTLLQARTTLCLIYLKTARARDARRAITGAWRYRTRERSLVVLALLALTTRQAGDRFAADQQFRLLLDEASDRIARDSEDFAAWDFRGYAICGMHLDTEKDLDDAIAAFQIARSHTPPTPTLVHRLQFILAELDRDGRRRDRLGPVIDGLDEPL